MSHDEKQCLKLGQMALRMIQDVLAVTLPGDVGYGRRTVTFPGGSIDLFVVSGDALGAAFDSAAEEKYSVQSATPRSQTN